MASLGHIAFGMAGSKVYGSAGATRLARTTSFGLWSALSLLPDVDVVGFGLGIPYGHAFGHRGATHSFAFCFALAATLGLVAWARRARPWRTFVVAALVLSSHPILDILTDGGLGCALFWPFAPRRYFAPWTPIPVAPIGAAFFSHWGLRVVSVELLLFAPIFAYALWPRHAAQQS